MMHKAVTAKKAVTVIIVGILLNVGLVAQPVESAISDGPARRVSTYAAIVAPGPDIQPLDFKQQSLTRKIPGESSRPIPNLDPLIEQLFRQASLSSSAEKILPWVYATSTEMVVADYEDAVKHIERAGDHLTNAMQHILLADGTLEQDPHLTLAIQELDRGEFTILFLLELAKLEL